MTKPLSKTLKTRRANLMRNGIPKHIRVYDKPDCMDRYTIVFAKVSENHCYPYAGASEHPFHPQGCGTFGMNRNFPVDRPNWQHHTKHLGKKIQFNDLPVDVKRMVKDDYMDLWNLKVKPTCI